MLSSNYVPDHRRVAHQLLIKHKADDAAQQRNHTRSTELRLDIEKAQKKSFDLQRIRMECQAEKSGALRKVNHLHAQLESTDSRVKDLASEIAQLLSKSETNTGERENDLAKHRTSSSKINASNIAKIQRNLDFIRSSFLLPVNNTPADCTNEDNKTQEISKLKSVIFSNKAKYVEYKGLLLNAEKDREILYNACETMSPLLSNVQTQLELTITRISTKMSTENQINAEKLSKLKKNLKILDEQITCAFNHYFPDDSDNMIIDNDTTIHSED